MRAVIQRVRDAKVTVDDVITGQITIGLLILLGVESTDSREDAEWLARKATDMRLFADDMGKMNLSLKDINGGCLIISQFTLHASTKKGNRPSFIRSAPPQQAEDLYSAFIDIIKEYSTGPVETGVFGAFMDVEFINEGPVTIIIDTKNRE